MSDIRPQTVNDAIKHHLLVLVGAILAVDVVAIAAFYALHLNGRAGTEQQTFIGVWILVSLAIVVVQQRKIRRARMSASPRPEKPKVS
jgi:hypothetical protein